LLLATFEPLPAARLTRPWGEGSSTSIYTVAVRRRLTAAPVAVLRFRSSSARKESRNDSRDTCMKNFVVPGA